MRELCISQGERGFGLTIVRFSPLYVRFGLIATKFGAAENCRDVPIVLTRRSRSRPCSFAWPRKRTKGAAISVESALCPTSQPALFPQASTQHFFVLAWPQSV